MSGVSSEYRALVESFLAGRVTASDLVTNYLAKFKGEARDIPDDEFVVLDKIFADVDAYTDDVVLIRENPDHYLNEAKLKEELAKALTQLPR